MSRPYTLLLTLALAACGREHAAVPPALDAVPVRLAPVTRERVARPVAATGVLGPKEEVPLGFKIGGVIGRILVDEGQTVHAGDTLAALDLSEIDAGVTRARSVAEKAERDLVRAQRLYQDSVATLEQVQNAQTGRDVAAAELETASFNRRYAVIIAPAAGVMLRRTAEPGQLVSSGTPILVLGSWSRGVVLRAALADRDVLRVRRGDRATVRFGALPDAVLEGVVSEIAAAADPMTGTYRVEVTLPGAAGLASGLVGQVEIAPGAATEVSLVPVEAVLEADGSFATVFTLSPDGTHVQRRAVRIGFLAGDRVAIISGLAGVRSVVTDGAAYLDDRALVVVRP
jgi:membrane fusion protein, multidrug efflux system